MSEFSAFQDKLIGKIIKLHNKGRRGTISMALGLAISQLRKAGFENYLDLVDDARDMAYLQIECK